MKTKAEILKAQKEIAMKILERDYGFIYDQLIKEARPALEEQAKTTCQDELNDQATENCHTEHLDGHNSDVSSSMDFDETKEVMDYYESTIELIAEVYSA